MDSDHIRNPYRNDGKPPSLKWSVLILMDVLGYKEMANLASEGGTSGEFLRDLYEALSEGRRLLSDGGVLSEDLRKLSPKDRSYLKAFTDNIVIGIPIWSDAEGELGDAFDKVARFQLNMTNRGFFVRGAISVGDAYIDEIAVVGDALLEAYRGESELARDPRVIVSESAKPLLKDHLSYYGSRAHAPQVRYLLQDSDGQWFVNYLNEILCAVDEVGPFYEELLVHKEATELNLRKYRDRPNIFSKYAWVAGYHNYFCDLYPDHSFGEYRIDVETFRAPFRSIID